MPATLASVVVAVALVQTSALLARGCQAALFAMLVHRLHDPVDAWVAADGFVLWVNEDDLVVLVCAVLVDPVAVKDSEVGASLAHTGFGGRLEGALVFELIDTLIGGFAWETALVPVPAMFLCH